MSTVEGLHPLVDRVQQAYREALRNYHNWNDWEDEQYERIELALKESSQEIVELEAQIETW